jgi:hypothetical protein
MNCKTETLHGEFYFAVLDLIGGFDQRATLREVKVAHAIEGLEPRGKRGQTKVVFLSSPFRQYSAVTRDYWLLDA